MSWRERELVAHGYARATPFGRCGWCGNEGAAPCQLCGSPDGGSNPGRGKGELGIQITGLADGGAPPGWSDKWLAEFDPYRAGRDPMGRPMLAHVRVSVRPADALRFSGVVSARREWMRWDGWIRPDGKPSRPLTAFTISMMKLPA